MAVKLMRFVLALPCIVALPAIAAQEVYRDSAASQTAAANTPPGPSSGPDASMLPPSSRLLSAFAPEQLTRFAQQQQSSLAYANMKSLELMQRMEVMPNLPLDFDPGQQLPIAKDFSIRRGPTPLLIATKKEIEQLRDELQVPIDLPQNVDPNMPDDHIVALPLTAEYIRRSSPSKLSSSSANGKSRTARSGHVSGSSDSDSDSDNSSSSNSSSSDLLSLERLLPLLRAHPLPALVHDEPALVMNILRTLAGPKPDGSRAPLEPLDPSHLPQNIGHLIELATRNPALVRSLARFDTKFIPSLVNVILGIEDEDDDDDDDNNNNDDDNNNSDKPNDN